MTPPLLNPLLRGLVFLAVLEAILGRIIPLSETAIAESLRESMAPALRAGEFLFVPAFALATASIAALALGLLKRACWPPGLNGFIAIGLLSLSAMGLAAMSPAGGPVLAAGFTLISLVVFYAVAMHAFASASSFGVRAVCVTYGAALTCSAIAQVVFLLSAPGIHGDGPSGRMAQLIARWGSSLEAGEILVVCAGLAGFGVWADMNGDGVDRRRRLLSALAGIPAASLYLVPRILASRSITESRAGFTATLAIESAALFLGVFTATGLMLNPQRHTKGIGLLLLLLAGFPLSSAYTHLLMVLGSALLFMPAMTNAPITSPRMGSPSQPGSFEGTRWSAHVP